MFYLIQMERIGYSVLKKLCSTSVEEMNKAFNLIFEKYRYLVYYVSFDILKSEDEAKDIVNETFLKMYERRRDFMSESKLKYFLLVTAKNCVLDKLYSMFCKWFISVYYCYVFHSLSSLSCSALQQCSYMPALSTQSGILSPIRIEYAPSTQYTHSLPFTPWLKSLTINTLLFFVIMWLLVFFASIQVSYAP